jgi:hypothetical protein
MRCQSVWLFAVSIVALAAPAFGAPDPVDDAPGEQEGNWAVGAEAGFEAPDPEVKPSSMAPLPAVLPSAVGTPSDPVADRPSDGAEDATEREVEKRVLHGFRLGYLFLMNHDKPVPSSDVDCPDCSLAERYDIRTPHQFLIGYEVMGRLVGHDWLNVLVVGNVLVSGIEQSKFFPSANLLIGFELDQSFQLGVGANFTVEEDKAAHMVLAAGWTPRAGSFYVPVHAFFIPDVDDNHRLGFTVGVNW